MPNREAVSINMNQNISKKTRDFLHAQGARATLARVEIINAIIVHQYQSFFACDIASTLESKGYAISSSTLNKTLHQLCQLGLLTKLRLNSGMLQFNKLENSKFFI
jgi:Fe2+ or Zn2+ uptake regulation protein